MFRRGLLEEGDFSDPEDPRESAQGTEWNGAGFLLNFLEEGKYLKDFFSFMGGLGGFFGILETFFWVL